MGEQHLHLRHKPPTELVQPRELILACPQLRSNVNLSRIVRAAGCCGVTRIVSAGGAIDSKIARDALAVVTIENRRSLAPALKRLRDEEGYQLVGLEQTTDSKNIHDFSFPRKCALVIGHERKGIEPDLLALLHETVEIPVWGQPHSYNAATAACMALYEYCRQFPRG